YIGNWWRGLALTEKWGSVIWKRIEPFTRALIPVSNNRQAFVLGLFWGWLPCGLVYAMVIWALASGSPLHSAGLMIAFGLGTLPALLVTGKLFRKIEGWVRSDRFRAVAGSTIIAFGVLALHHALMTRFDDHSDHTKASSTTRLAPVSSSRAPAILRKLW
ncbi:MAG: sulfite exporter TauE/SafE family protein, partial [Pseudomonadota bacterium]